MPPPPPDDSGAYARGGTFYEVLTAAVADLSEHGYDSQERLTHWVRVLREAAIRTMTPPRALEAALNETMRAVYRRQVERGGILKLHPGVSRFTLDRVAPRLRSELDRRIMASAALIKLNREKALTDTLSRFSGWATSIPAGGSDAVDRAETKATIRKALASLPYVERRVAIDQSHKLTASLSNVLAVDGGAIALVWHSHWRQSGYHYRPDHKERDGHTYLIRGSWAQESGLVKPGADGYYDEITSVGEEVFCRCFATYLYAVRRLPEDMVTVKGRQELAKTKLAA